MKFPHIPSLVEKSDILVFKTELFEISGRNTVAGSDERGRVDVLEYGAGYSAIYYPLFMEKVDIPYEWHSIEHNFGWAAKLKALILKHKVNSNIWLCDVPIKHLKKCGNNPGKELYITHPDLIKKKFDLIYVDGRIRNRCLARCPKYLKPGGVVLLDNANRKKYRPGMKKYKGEFIKPWIWRGTL